MIKNLLHNVATAKDVLARAIPQIAPPRTCACPSLLANAIITDPKTIPLTARRRLELLIGKYLPAEKKGRRRA